MNTPSRVKLKNSDVQRANGKPLSQPTSQSTTSSVTMFNNANNTLINNSSFNISSTINYNTIDNLSAGSPLGLLYKFAAPNAILNSGGRADEVRCHPGTRKEVIDVVEKSIAQEGSEPRMLWLSGPAGAGKTAIMQTVAERCEEHGVPHANFFFFRADSSRRDVSSLVATLIHQIIQLYPSVGATVAATLSSNPLLFQMGIQKQFDALMPRTLAAIQDSPTSLQPLALLIDGLDECDSENKTGQRQLLQALDTLLVQKGPYFRIVVASRVEPQIAMAFSQLRSPVDTIFLDEKYSPEEDIRLFVTAEFNKIKSGHYLAPTLGPDWPSESDINGIVSKSSGQFIYAATVMRFIAHSPASPILSLQKVQGIVPLSRNTPFAHLDAVYTYILEQADDLEAVKDVLAITLSGVNYATTQKQLLEAYQPRYSEAVFNSCISELTPIVYLRRNFLQFFHASFSDFLQDKTRARVYHIDLETFCTVLFPVLWVSSKEGQLYLIVETALKRVQKPTPEITTTLMDSYPNILPNKAHAGVLFLLEHLHRLYDIHDPDSFCKIMRKWISYDELKGLAPFLQEQLSKSATSWSNQVPAVGGDLKFGKR